MALIIIKIILSLFLGLCVFVWGILTIRQFFMIYGTEEQKDKFRGKDKWP